MSAPKRTSRDKQGAFEMVRNGLVVRVEVKVRAVGRNSKWTGAQVGSVVDTLTNENMARITNAEFWATPDNPGPVADPAAPAEPEGLTL